MDRRTFLAATGVAGLASAAPSLQAQETAAEPAFSAGSSPEGPALLGSAVVSGPAPESIVILQPLQRHATGYLEYAVGDGPLERVDSDQGGLLPFDPHVLKFRLPPLPLGTQVRYRVTAKTIGWVPVREFVHGRIVAGPEEVGPEAVFKTLDPAADATRFVVWNDTHENADTLAELHKQTAAAEPDFLLWNGDQTNDVHFRDKLAGQVLAPLGLPIAARWPLAYVRGNHDVRGPAARSLPEFTGTPDDQFFFAFRSGPLAALVMDTGEDKADDHPNFAGLAAFERLRERQAAWLAQVIELPWFQEAAFRVLFCHLPLWWIRDRKDIDWWEYSQASRDLWLPKLLEGRVSLVVSGHTHHAAWLPASASQPIAQLIGGGPQPRAATILEGTATRRDLDLTMKRLDGTVVSAVRLAAG